MFVFLVLPSFLAADSFIKISSPNEKESHVRNIKEPVLVEGTCSPDIQSIEIEYWFTPQSYSSNAKPLEQVDTYKLKKFKPGSGSFFYRIFPSLGNLGCGTNEYRVKGTTAKGQSVTETFTVFSSFYFGERAKPVIYLYPQTATKVFVNVKPTAGVSVSDPVLGKGWTVQAQPDGRLTNLTDGKTYPYLFWESPDDSRPFRHKDGFVVAKKQVADFFKIRLAQLGLNQKETADFIEYWTKALADYPWYHFHFLSKAEIDAAAPLEVNPKPDSVIRIYFEYRGLEDEIAVPPQTLTTPKRQGFTVVEWGGRKYQAKP